MEASPVRVLCVRGQRGFYSPGPPIYPYRRGRRPVPAGLQISPPVLVANSTPEPDLTFMPRFDRCERPLSANPSRARDRLLPADRAHSGIQELDPAGYLLSRRRSAWYAASVAPRPSEMPGVKAMGKYGAAPLTTRRRSSRNPGMPANSGARSRRVRGSPEEEQRQTDALPGRPQRGSKEITSQGSPAFDPGVAALAV